MLKTAMFAKMAFILLNVAQVTNTSTLTPQNVQQFPQSTVKSTIRQMISARSALPTICTCSIKGVAKRQANIQCKMEMIGFAKTLQVPLSQMTAVFMIPMVFVWSVLQTLLKMSMEMIWCIAVLMELLLTGSSAETLKSFTTTAPIVLQIMSEKTMVLTEL